MQRIKSKDQGQNMQSESSLGILLLKDEPWRFSGIDLELEKMLITQAENLPRAKPLEPRPTGGLVSVVTSLVVARLPAPPFTRACCLGNCGADSGSAWDLEPGLAWLLKGGLLGPAAFWSSRVWGTLRIRIGSPHLLTVGSGCLLTDGTMEVFRDSELHGTDRKAEIKTGKLAYPQTKPHLHARSLRTKSPQLCSDSSLGWLKGTIAAPVAGLGSPRASSLMASVSLFCLRCCLAAGPLWQAIPVTDHTFSSAFPKLCSLYIYNVLYFLSYFIFGIFKWIF